MIDEIDLKIMYLLGQDGRIPNIELAKKLDIPNSTVRQRLMRLKDMGVLNFSCEISPQRFKEVIIVFCGITIHTNRANILSELDKFPHALFSAGVTGRYDFVVVLAAESMDKVNTILGKINNIDGVDHTESFIVLENNGLLIRSDKFSRIIQEEMKIKQNSLTP